MWLLPGSKILLTAVADEIGQEAGTSRMNLSEVGTPFECTILPELEFRSPRCFGMHPLEQHPSEALRWRVGEVD